MSKTTSKSLSWLLDFQACAHMKGTWTGVWKSEEWIAVRVHGHPDQFSVCAAGHLILGACWCTEQWWMWKVCSFTVSDVNSCRKQIFGFIRMQSGKSIEYSSISSFCWRGATYMEWAWTPELVCIEVHFLSGCLGLFSLVFSTPKLSSQIGPILF